VSEIPEEIEAILSGATNPSPMKISLHQRTVELVKHRGVGMDVDWDTVVRDMSTQARRFVVDDSLVEKLRAFAQFDIQFAMVEILFASMIMVSVEKMGVHQEKYEQVHDWYEHVFEFMMHNLRSILGNYSRTPEDLGMLLVDFQEAVICEAEGRTISSSTYERMVELYKEGEYLK